MTRDRWQLHDLRGNTTGLYYTLTIRTNGTLEACVTVKWTRHDTAACLTCHSTTCTHSRWVRTYRKAHGEPVAA